MQTVNNRAVGRAHITKNFISYISVWLKYGTLAEQRRKFNFYETKLLKDVYKFDPDGA